MLALQANIGFSLAIEWERCPDGVDLVDLRPEPLPENASLLERIRPEGLHFRPKNPNRVTERLSLDSLESLVALRFTNASDVEALRAFLDRYGLPVAYGEDSLERLVSRQRELKSFLNDYVPYVHAKRGEVQRQIINEFLKGFVLSPQIAIGALGMNVELKPRSLWQYMFMELLLAASLGAQPHACENCGDVFLTGKHTERRSTAHFCSDKCRVASFRNARRKVSGERDRLARGDHSLASSVQGRNGAVK